MELGVVALRRKPPTMRIELLAKIELKRNPARVVARRFTSLPVIIGTMQPAPPARPDGDKTSTKIDGQPSPLSAAAVTNGSSAREVERRSPEVALSYAVASAAPSTSGSSTRESDSSGPVQKINSTLIASTRRPFDGVAVRASHLSVS